MATRSSVSQSQQTSGPDYALPNQATNAPRGQYVPPRLLTAAPPIEAWIDRAANEYRLSIAVPGVDPNDLQLHIEGSSLTVQGNQQPQTRSANTEYLQREFSRQRVHRTIALPDSVDTEKLTARYANGILEIVAPLKESAASKRIQINSGTQQTTAQEQAKGAGASR